MIKAFPPDDEEHTAPEFMEELRLAREQRWAVDVGLTPEARANLAVRLFGVRIVPEVAERNVNEWLEADRHRDDWARKIAARREEELARPIMLDLHSYGKLPVPRAVLEKVCGPFGVDALVDIAEELLIEMLDADLIELYRDDWGDE